MGKQLKYEIIEKDGLYTMIVEFKNGLKLALKEKVTQEELLKFGEGINWNIKKFIDENNKKLN